MPVVCLDVLSILAGLLALVSVLFVCKEKEEEEEEDLNRHAFTLSWHQTAKALQCLTLLCIVVQLNRIESSFVMPPIPTSFSSLPFPRLFSFLCLSYVDFGGELCSFLVSFLALCCLLLYCLVCFSV